MFNNNNNQPLKKNSRFDCLHSNSSSSSNSRSRSSSRNYQQHERSRSYSRPTMKLSSDKYSFLSKKKSVPTLKDDMKNGKFPSLINVKKNYEKSKQETVDFLNIVSNSENDEDKKRDENSNEEPKEGWIFMNSVNGITKIHTYDKKGKETPIEKNNIFEEPIENEMTHKEFQRECAYASYSILKDIQERRDEDIKVLGANSKYYNKGNLLDLSYLSLSDSEFEQSDSDQEEDIQNDYCSDDETY